MLTSSGKKVQIFLFTGLKPRQIRFQRMEKRENELTVRSVLFSWELQRAFSTDVYIRYRYFLRKYSIRAKARIYHSCKRFCFRLDIFRWKIFRSYVSRTHRVLRLVFNSVKHFVHVLRTFTMSASQNQFLSAKKRIPSNLIKL